MSQNRGTEAVSARRIAPPLRVTVLRGGPSAEREVSLISGKRVAAALRLLGHKVFEADISPDDLSALDEPADVVFIALHGTFGEDGQVQRILDERGLPYCGSGPEASALTMDKQRTKHVCSAAGIPTPRCERLDANNWQHVCETWPLPFVVKPIAEGSSVDCHIVRSRDTIASIVPELVSKYGAVMIETFVDGYEMTVGILDGAALPPIWIRPATEFYDYQAKYVDDRTQYEFDAPLPPAVLERICEQSLEAFRVTGCRDFARIDWLVDKRTHEPWMLEINTIPGLTDHSLVPKAAAHVGIGFGEFCQRLLVMALRRHSAAQPERAAG